MEMRQPEAGLLSDLSHFLTVSSYARQLDVYREAFPTTPVKIILFDEFKAAPISVVRDVCRHLSINPDIPWCAIPPLNVRRSENNASAFRLSPELRLELAEHLAPDMRRLRDEYGVDVSCWGFT